MKTIKSLLIVSFVAFAMLSTSNAYAEKGKGPKKTVSMNFHQAMNIDWVVGLMHELDSDFLSSTKPTYTIEILYNNRVIRIHGSYNQWAWFFRPYGPNFDGPLNPKHVRHR